MKNNNNNNSSSYSIDVAYPNMNNINKNNDLIINDSINNNSKITSFISKAKQNITKRCKKKSTKDIINLVTKLAVKKRRQSNSKFKPKTNDSISKNVKMANAKETVFITREQCGEES